MMPFDVDAKPVPKLIKHSQGRWIMGANSLIVFKEEPRDYSHKYHFRWRLPTEIINLRRALVTTVKGNKVDEMKKNLKQKVANK